MVLVELSLNEARVLVADRSGEVSVAVNNSFGFGGQNASLVLRAVN